MEASINVRSSPLSTHVLPVSQNLQLTLLPDEILNMIFTLLAGPCPERNRKANEQYAAFNFGSLTVSHSRALLNLRQVCKLFSTILAPRFKAFSESIPKFCVTRNLATRNFKITSVIIGGKMYGGRKAIQLDHVVISPDQSGSQLLISDRKGKALNTIRGFRDIQSLDWNNGVLAVGDLGTMNTSRLNFYKIKQVEAIEIFLFDLPMGLEVSPIRNYGITKAALTKYNAFTQLFEDLLDPVYTRSERVIKKVKLICMVLFFYIQSVCRKFGSTLPGYPHLFKLRSGFRFRYLNILRAINNIAVQTFVLISLVQLCLIFMGNLKNIFANMNARRLIETAPALPVQKRPTLNPAYP